MLKLSRECLQASFSSWYGNSARDLNIASIERKIYLAMINSLSFRHRYLIAFDWMYHGHWKYNISKTELLCPVDMLFLQRFSRILLSHSCSSQKTKIHSNNSLCLRLQHPISCQIDKILTTSIHFFPRNQVIIFFLPYLAYQSHLAKSYGFYRLWISAHFLSLFSTITNPVSATIAHHTSR